MAKYELKLPKMGESVAEATITSWLKEVGDTIEADESILEIATDKVDSEVPSEVDGILTELLYKVDDVVKVGDTIAIIETEASVIKTAEAIEEAPIESIKEITKTVEIAKESLGPISSQGDRFYSPLVRNIAKEEGVTPAELLAISGTGKNGRVTKADMQLYLKTRSSQTRHSSSLVNGVESSKHSVSQKTPIEVDGGDEIIALTRMGKLISHHMIQSVQTSAHVQSFIEADVSNIWNWRKKVKKGFIEREGENLTFTPIFIEAVAKSLRDFPMINISLQDDKIIKKKNINIGMAAALPDGNLIVPVIKNADQLNLVGMTKKVNDLAKRARDNKLKPDDIQGGTYTVTNVGTFGSIMGTPIINQPQVGILAFGAIRKTPAVIETPDGDFIGIRYKMYLSHSYDHRVVNGALGGQFVKSVKDYLEAWDVHREI